MIKKISILITGFVIMFSPMFIFAALTSVSVCPTSEEIKFNGGLVPTCNTIIDSKGNVCDPCNFEMVMALINKVISFILFDLATPLFALILMYVGWLYLSDQGSAENKNKAKKIFKNAFIGYVIALAAWLIVKTILVSLDFNGPMYLR